MNKTILHRQRHPNSHKGYITGRKVLNFNLESTMHIVYTPGDDKYLFSIFHEDIGEALIQLSPDDLKRTQQMINDVFRSTGHYFKKDGRRK